MSCCSPEGRDLLKSSCTLAGAAAVLSVEAHPRTVQAKDPAGAVRDSDDFTVLPYRVTPEQFPAEMASDAAEGMMANSAVSTYLGCMLT